VIRAERRTETPGQLQRLLDDLQEVIRNEPGHGGEKLAEKLRAIETRFRRIIEDLDREDQQFVTRELRNVVLRAAEREGHPVTPETWDRMPFLDEETRRRLRPAGRKRGRGEEAGEGEPPRETPPRRPILA